MERPRVSVVVPVLADAEAAERLLQQIPHDARLEIVLADGGHDPRLEMLAAARSDTVVVRSRPGRGAQMNAGAAVARGEWLLFLHADSTLPDGWIDAWAHAARGAAGGWFRFALDDASWQARLIERGVQWRVRLFRLPYGDQGIFVRRGTFSDMGGYRDMPLMEDADFVRRLIAVAPVVELPIALTTSARRWRRDGWLRRSVRNLLLLSLYFAGVPPIRLAQWYTRHG